MSGGATSSAATITIMFERDKKPISKQEVENHLRRWAHEMAGGEGKSNLIARLHEAPGGIPEFSSPPGGLFSPTAEKTDQLLKDIRNLDGRLYRMLISRAVGLTLDDMARNAKESRGALHIELEAALAMLRMGLWMRR